MFLLFSPFRVANMIRVFTTSNGVVTPAVNQKKLFNSIVFIVFSFISNIQFIRLLPAIPPAIAPQTATDKNVNGKCVKLVQCTLKYSHSGY